MSGPETTSIVGCGPSFGRVAHLYDRTRWMPPEAKEQVALAIVRLSGLLAGAWALEHAVGTGRIAAPLGRQGIRVVGCDVSARMLARCASAARASAPGSMALLRGDATRLALSDRSVHAVISAWVLHLLPAWREAVDEARRVLTHDGRFVLLSTQLADDSPSAVVRAQWHALLERDVGPAPAPLGAERAVVVDHLVATGGERQADSVRYSVPVTAAALVDRIAGRQDSTEWRLPDSAFGRPVEELRAFTYDRYDAGAPADELTTTIDALSWSRPLEAIA